MSATFWPPTMACLTLDQRNWCCSHGAFRAEVISVNHNLAQTVSAPSRRQGCFLTLPWHTPAFLAWSGLVNNDFHSLHCCEPWAFPVATVVLEPLIWCEMTQEGLAGAG